MSDFRFWRTWPADLRLPYLFLLALTLLTISWSIFEYLAGPDRAVPWHTETDFSSVPLVIEQFSRLVQNFEVTAPGYIITQRFAAGTPVLSAVVAYIYLSMLAIAAVYFLTALTTLKRIAYAVGMLLFMLLVATFNVDALGLININRNYFLIGIIVLYGLLTYYFQAFAPNTRFTIRLLSIGLLTLAVATGIYLLSNYDAYTTSLHMIGHSSSAVLLAGLLFVVMVSFDNIQAVLWLNGQGTTPQQRAGAARFAIVSLLYLLSLLFIFLAQIGFFQVDISFITPFFLLVVSFLTGLWGFRQRQTIFHRFMPFATAGSFIYLSLAILAFLGAAYAFGTANDPIIEAFNDAVLFTHLAFGLLFFVFLMINFGPAIHKRLPVYKVVYQAQRVPFFTVYGAGTVLLVILVTKTNMLSIDQARAGYYNYLGDLYRTEGNDLLAERYYQEGHVFENNNVRSNMNLATIAAEKNFLTTEIVFLKRTLNRRSQEKMFVRLANAYAAKGNLFDALFTTREGLKKYPESYRLHSNMALLFSRTDLVDSVNFYLAKAQNLSDDPAIKTNTLAFMLNNGALKEAKEYATKNSTEQHAAFKSNTTMANLLSGQAADERKLPDTEQKAFNDGSFMLFYHQVLAGLPTADTTTLHLLDKVLKDKANEPYSEKLNLLKALTLHYHADRAEARKILEQLTLSAPANDGYYFNLMGLWLLEEKLYFAAADYFSKAKEAGYAPAFVHHIYALTLAGETKKVANESVMVLASGNPRMIKQAVELQQLLSTSPNVITTSGSDTVRAQLLQLYNRQLPAEMKVSVLSSFRNQHLKAEGLANVAEQLVEEDKLQEAKTVLQQLENEELVKALPEGKFARVQASVLLAQKQYEPLLQTLGKANFGAGYETLKNYYRAVSLWRLGRPAKAAPYFRNLPSELPYHAPAVIETANFYAQQQDEPMKAYELLQSGLAYDPYSVPILKAYIYRALDLNLTEYADYSLEKLSELVPADEYSTFKTRYEQAVANKSQTADKW